MLAIPTRVPAPPTLYSNPGGANFEPDDEWKRQQKEIIEQIFKPTIQDNKDIWKARFQSGFTPWEHLDFGYKLMMNEINHRMDVHYQMVLMSERADRRWTAGAQMLSGWNVNLREKQQNFMNNIDNPTPPALYSYPNGADFEPDYEWKRQLKEEIQQVFKPVIRGAKVAWQAQLEIGFTARKRLDLGYKLVMTEIKNRMEAHFQLRLMSERANRRWDAGAQMLGRQRFNLSEQQNFMNSIDQSSHIDNFAWTAGENPTDKWHTEGSPLSSSAAVHHGSAQQLSNSKLEGVSEDVHHDDEGEDDDEEEDGSDDDHRKLLMLNPEFRLWWLFVEKRETAEEPRKVKEQMEQMEELWQNERNGVDARKLKMKASRKEEAKRNEAEVKITEEATRVEEEKDEARSRELKEQAPLLHRNSSISNWSTSTLKLAIIPSKSIAPSKSIPSIFHKFREKPVPPTPKGQRLHPPSREYLAAELVDSPLGLTNPIPRGLLGPKEAEIPRPRNSIRLKVDEPSAPGQPEGLPPRTYALEHEDEPGPSLNASQTVQLPPQDFQYNRTAQWIITSGKCQVPKKPIGNQFMARMADLRRHIDGTSSTSSTSQSKPISLMLGSGAPSIESSAFSESFSVASPPQEVEFPPTPVFTDTVPKGLMRKVEPLSTPQTSALRSAHFNTAATSSSASSDSNSTPRQRPTKLPAPSSSIRLGYWNRRGDHLTPDGYVVFPPLNMQYPLDLRAYPFENQGYQDHTGLFVAYVRRPELPQSLPKHGQPPERPYESFVIYI